jgi:hypothetical protein
VRAVLFGYPHSRDLLGDPRQAVNPKQQTPVLARFSSHFGLGMPANAGVLLFNVNRPVIGAGEENRIAIKWRQRVAIPALPEPPCCV